MIEPASSDRRLCICVLGDLDGVHTKGWMRYFVERGHDVHGVSYYEPVRPPEGVQVHALHRGLAAKEGESFPKGTRSRATGGFVRRLPSGVQRLANLVRYRRAGLRRVVEAIAPDVLHAHYLVEHALYGTAAGFRPYVVSAWGSDVLVEPQRSRLNHALARFVLRRATLATANNRYMLREMVLKLGIERAFAQHIVLGVSRDFIDGAPPSVNAQPRDSKRAPVVISTRSLDAPLYNVDVILRAMARVRERLPAARLLVVGEGRLRRLLESLAKELGLGECVSFASFISQDALREALCNAEVFVSVPSSDGTSVALLQGMAAGCFPIVSDLPSQQELIEDGVRGVRVPVRDGLALAEAIVRALEDGELRRAAAQRNRAFVEDYGVTEANMARMEAWYYRLAGRSADLTAG